MFSYESIFFFILIAKKELDTTLFFVANSPNQSGELKKLSNEQKHQWKTAFKGYSKKTWKKHWYLLASLKLNQSFQLKLYLANTLAKNSPRQLIQPKINSFCLIEMSVPNKQGVHRVDSKTSYTFANLNKIVAILIHV